MLYFVVAVTIRGVMNQENNTREFSFRVEPKALRKESANRSTPKLYAFFSSMYRVTRY